MALGFGFLVSLKGTLLILSLCDSKVSLNYLKSDSLSNLELKSVLLYWSIVTGLVDPNILFYWVKDLSLAVNWPLLLYFCDNYYLFKFIITSISWTIISFYFFNLSPISWTSKIFLLYLASISILSYSIYIIKLNLTISYFLKLPLNKVNSLLLEMYFN